MSIWPLSIWPISCGKEYEFYFNKQKKKKKKQVDTYNLYPF